MRRHGFTVLLAASALTITLAPAAAQHPGAPGAGMPCMMGMPPDSATRAQMSVIRELVMNHEKITRTVENLSNGVRTVTESSDPRIAQLLSAHVATMDGRATKGEHLMMPMESAALRAVMEGKQKIRTTIDATQTGVVVVQTSSDPKLATALQTHAAEVSALVAGGMTAMRDSMMKNGPCTMPMGKPPR